MTDLRLGFSTSSCKPVLHIYAGSIHHFQHPDKKTYTKWVCGRGAWNPKFVDRPNGLAPCRKCYGPIAVPFDEVYFAEKDGLIKIGQSNNTARRVASLDATLLATLPGDGRTEVALHIAFAHLRVTGEWFRPAPELLRVVENAAARSEVERLAREARSAS